MLTVCHELYKEKKKYCSFGALNPGARWSHTRNVNLFIIKKRCLVILDCTKGYCELEREKSGRASVMK